MTRRRSASERLARGERPEAVLADAAARRRRRVPPDEDAFASPLHDERVAALVGIGLAIAFVVCLLTGLVSHLIQDPVRIGTLSQPTAPASLYRFTQGVHIAAGMAAIPLLLVKLWAVYPRLFRRPPVAGAAHAVERALVALLVGGSLFILITGVMTTAQWVPWEFRFRQTHYYTAWIVIGALVAHIGAKLAISRHALGAEARAQARAADQQRARSGQLTRRGLVLSAFAGAGIVALTTVGQALTPLRDLALLAPRRSGVGPQGLPINRTAMAAKVLQSARSDDWRLVVEGDVASPLRLSLAQLEAMPQHEVELPIACVEGWSASVVWTGVPVRDLLARAGAPAGARGAVESLERGGLRRSELNPAQAAHPDTLLALRIAGEPLHIDHGYPCRLVGPNRPGVQQTKWVARVEVTRA